jgi:exodeoxyribonuclease V
LTSITLSDMQRDAVDKAKKWYEKQDKQTFTIAGYAGTGKSTIVKAMIDELQMGPNNVRFCTFTGKAALVLSLKGNPATTIHRLQYDVIEVEDQETGKKKRRFVRKLMLDPTIKLLVVDEVSMVSKKLLEDLKMYKIPIICLGDPGQLPPIGEDNGVLKNPDVFLTEIHRQAEDNPIIHLSMLARQGKRIDLGMYGKYAAVIDKNDVHIDMLLKANQVICGKNVTRRDLNMLMREHQGFTSEFPEKGDKILCKKNDWQTMISSTALINGLIGYVKEEVESVNHDAGYFKLDFRPEFVTDDYFEGLNVSFKNFISGYNDEDGSANSEQNHVKKHEFDFGNAITCHASQGSQWEKVFVYSEILRSDLHPRWLYTAITRAENKLIVAI